MDLKDIKPTSTYAIKAVYNNFWALIPNKYKVPEDDKMIHEMYPFYDAELTFDNRMHYKLTNVAYPKRSEPWFIITWNTENGLLKSSLTQRRFQTKVEEVNGKKLRFKFLNVELSINFGICCNTMEGLYELQENFLLKKREKMIVYTEPHPILGSFPVCLDVVDSNQNKLPRDKGTLCYLFLQCKIDYHIIGMIEDITSGIIERINLDTYNEALQSHDTILP